MKRMINTAIPALGTQSLRAYVAMVRQRAVEIFGIAIMCAIVGRKSNEKRRLEKLDTGYDERQNSETGRTY